MEVYKADKKIFWRSELKTWIVIILFTAFLLFLFKFLFNFSSNNIFMSVLIIFLLKLSNTLTQYHVVEIQIDKNNNQLNFILESIMSGEKVKKNELSQTSSELIFSSGFIKYLSPKFYLKILLGSNDIFKITSRYGFSLNTLTLVNKSLENIVSPIAKI